MWGREDLTGACPQSWCFSWALLNNCSSSYLGLPDDPTIPKHCGNWERFFCEEQLVVREGTSAAELSVCSGPSRCFCLLQPREVVLPWWSPHRCRCFFYLSQAFSVSSKQESQCAVILTADKWVWWGIQFVPSLAKELNFFLELCGGSPRRLGEWEESTLLDRPLDQFSSRIICMVWVKH